MLTRETLSSAWRYDAETGIFTRRVAAGRHGCHKAGEIAACKSHGYVVIGIAGKNYGAHRLAWLYQYGEWPVVIDHINGNRADNRISNLRNVTQTENMQNLRAAPSTSKSGLLGAFRHGRSKQWTARIRINGVSTRLGLFATPDEAHQAYLVAKRIHHPGGTI